MFYHGNRMIDRKEIINEYKENKNISYIANTLQILITEGLLTSPVIVRIKQLMDQGLNKQDICTMLSISSSTYNDNVGYSKCIYHSENRSKQAIRSERFRIRELLYKERIKRLKGEKHGY